jgi:tRNA G46 methylase TrmB
MNEQGSFVLDNDRIPWMEDRVSSWEYQPRPVDNMTPDELQKVRVYTGPARILEIGCANGAWCFKMKEDYPDWIIEGLDDVDHWSKVRPDLLLRYV